MIFIKVRLGYIYYLTFKNKYSIIVAFVCITQYFYISNIYDN